MKKIVSILIFAFAITLFSTGCFSGHSIKGNGNVVTKERKVDSFNQLIISGTFSAKYNQAENASLKITTDENLQDYIETEVHNGTLYIKPKKFSSIRPTSQEIQISSPTLNFVELSGACKLVCDSLSNPNDKVKIDVSGASKAELKLFVKNVETDISGASNINLNGTTEELIGDCSGASKLEAGNLVANNVTVNVSGASKASVQANKKLVVDASGASKVTYKGNPEIEKNVSGVSNVEKE